MKMSKAIVIFSTLITGVLTVNAQTAEEIAAKWTSAMGGQEKLASLQSIYLENELNIMNNEAPGKTYILNGKGFRSETDFNGQKIIDCYTVNGGWMVNPLAGQADPKPMPELQIKAGQLRLETAGPLFNYAAKGSKLELAGKEDLNGVQVYKLILTTKDGTKESLYLDVNTFFILKESMTMSANGQEFEIATTFSDYKKTESGFLMPYSSNLSLPGLSIAITAKKIEVNQPVDPAMFEMPKK